MEAIMTDQTTDKHDEVSREKQPGAELILNSGPGSVAVLDLNTLRLHYCNSEFENVFGYSEDQIKHQDFTFRNLISDAQLERFMFQVEQVSDKKLSLSKYVVYRLNNSRGEERSYYLYLSPIKNYEHLFHLLIIPDLSEWSFPFSSFDGRELFLQQLQTEKFGSFEWMISSGRVFWSDTLYDIYEIERGTPVTRETVATYTHPEDARKGNIAVQRALDTTGNIDIEMKIITGKKNVKVVKVLAKIIKSETGEPVKLVGSIKDITTQKRIELDLKRKVEELNRSNKELEEFAYVASHDLQEPLRKISTFSDRLSEKYGELLTGEGTMYIERMMASADNMRNLINNLLEFSRVTRDKQPFEPIDLNFLMTRVKNELELVVEETGTSIQNSNLPVVDGALPQLVQLFTNIISNAIKFRKEGVQSVIKVYSEPVSELEAITHHLPTEQQYCKIVIEDNGIGFEEEYAQRIFQIFQRLHGKSEYPGSGIGLAICKRIVEHHNGVIYAEGVEGEGARFYIILPELQAQ